MEASFHALALLVVLAVVVAVRATQETTRPSVARVSLALLAVLVGMIILPSHMCDLGDPVAQQAIPLLSVAYAIVFLRRWYVAVGLSVPLLVASYALSFHYIKLVHSGAYVGRGGDPDASWLWHSIFTGIFALNA